jgi:hypothetical protein
MAEHNTVVAMVILKSTKLRESEHRFVKRDHFFQSIRGARNAEMG